MVACIIIFHTENLPPAAADFLLFTYYRPFGIDLQNIFFLTISFSKLVKIISEKNANRFRRRKNTKSAMPNFHRLPVLAAGGRLIFR